MNRAKSSKLLLAAAAATFVAASVHSIAGAQDKPAPAPAWKAKNLQVLPPDMPREQLFGVMKKFSQALGVRCTFCHVGKEGEPLSTFNFSSDAKREKEMARWMMRVTQDINSKFETDMNKPAVTCYTCHRGAAHPLIVPPPAEPPSATPAASHSL